MGIPHKHSEVIKAWADGAKIEMSVDDVIWADIEAPQWNKDVNYRVKREPSIYRVAKMADVFEGYYTTTADSREAGETLEASNNFIKWLDDWVEYQE